MKKLLTILLLISFKCYSLGPVAYYFSAAGLAGNDGLTPATSWPLSKASTFTFGSNDTLRFNKGDIMYGAIIPTRSNLHFETYGTGNAPIISGLTAVVSWTNLGGNIWESTALTGVPSDVNLVLRNGSIQQVGRYPNANAVNQGYLSTTAVGTSSITGPALSTTTNWTGAQLVLRAHRWEMLKHTVTSHSAGVVGFAYDGNVPELGYGYFFQRDSRTLDIDGEWYYNPSTNKLRMYFGNNNPSPYTIQISTIDTLFNNVYGNVTVDGLSFVGANKKGIFNYGGSGFTVTNCTVNNSGKEAITSWYGVGASVTNCTVDNSLGSGIRLRSEAQPDNLTVTGNTVDSTCLIAGMESSGENNGGEGIYSYADSVNNISNNTITNSGNNGISWYGSTVLVKNNYILNCNSVRDDGGGIYTFEAHGSTFRTRYNRRITSNIIVNSIGNNNGTNNAYGTKANGIYLDEGTRTVIADSNTVISVRGAALIGNNIGYVTARNNTFYNQVFNVSFERMETAPLIRNLTFTKNIYYPYKWYYTNLQLDVPTPITLNTDMAALGTLDSNYNYRNTGIDSAVFRRGSNTGTSGYFEEYKIYSYLTNTILQEVHSTIVNTANVASTIQYNTSASPITYSFAGLSKKDIYGNVYNNSTTIPAWGSKILLDNGTITNNLPTANAGADQTITLPTNSTTLTGSGTDTDGTIVAYNWTKISGPSGTNYITNNTASIGINNLVQGVYVFQLTVTDNAGGTATDQVQVTVNPSPNANPVVTITVPSVTITLPINYTTLAGTATDDGTITGYSWSKVTGPSAYTIVTVNSNSTSVTNLVQGTYQFVLTATDNNNATGSGVMTVNVLANPTPVPSTSVILYNWKF